MSNYDDLLFDIALSMTPGIGPIHAKSLIEHCGNAESVFSEKPHILQKIKNIGPVRAKSLGKESLKRAEQELTFVEKKKNSGSSLSK